MILLKRAYEKAAASDGIRILVDRLWPRGISKAKLQLDGWEKEIAPSTKLRIWFGHDPARWSEFKKRYKAELKARKKELASLKARARSCRLTLVYGAKDTEYTHALVLQSLLER